MQGVLAGFTTIGAIIALGLLLAHLGILDLNAQGVLSHLAFFVTSPALMVTVLGGAEIHEVFSRNVIASAVGVAVSAACYLVVARLVWRKSAGDAAIGTLSAVYVNAGNLGIAIATYVLGSTALVAPMLLMQLLVIQPVALAVLDTSVAAQRFSLWRTVVSPLRNPLTVASLVGLGIAATGITLPRMVQDPLELVAGMAVPTMLLAYGVSLRLGSRPGRGTSVAETSLIVVLKLVVQPLVAYGTARFLLDVGGTALLAITVFAALPTAQNIFMHAIRYERAVVVARDTIFLSTVLSVPTLFLVAALLA